MSSRTSGFLGDHLFTREFPQGNERETRDRDFYKPVTSLSKFRNQLWTLTRRNLHVQQHYQICLPTLHSITLLPGRWQSCGQSNQTRELIWLKNNLPKGLIFAALARPVSDPFSGKSHEQQCWHNHELRTGHNSHLSFLAQLKRFYAEPGL